MELLVINGDNVLDRQPSNSTRVATGALKNMGCIELNGDAIYVPTNDLRLALPDLQARTPAPPGQRNERRE